MQLLRFTWILWIFLKFHNNFTLDSMLSRVWCLCMCNRIHLFIYFLDLSTCLFCFCVVFPLLFISINYCGLKWEHALHNITLTETHTYTRHHVKTFYPKSKWNHQLNTITESFSVRYSRHNFLYDSFDAFF